MKNSDTDSSSDPHSDKSRPPSLELLDHASSLYADTHSACSTPSPPPSPAPERRSAEVSIPRLDSNARALEVRPRSPLNRGEGAFSRFPNGMIQVRTCMCACVASCLFMCACIKEEALTSKHVDAMHSSVPQGENFLCALIVLLSLAHKHSEKGLGCVSGECSCVLFASLLL